MNNVNAFKLTQKSRDDARCTERIRREAKPMFAAIKRNRTREIEHARNPYRHPKWRKAALDEAMEKWWNHGHTLEDAIAKVRASFLPAVGDLPT